MAQWRELSPPTNVSRVRFRPSVTCGLSLSMVLVLLWGFFSGFFGFPPSTKTNTPTDPHENQLRLIWLPLSRYCNFLIFLSYLINMFSSFLVEAWVQQAVASVNDGPGLEGLQMTGLYLNKGWQLMLRKGLECTCLLWSYNRKCSIPH